eukprot:gene11776-biopygen16110
MPRLHPLPPSLNVDTQKLLPCSDAGLGLGLN